MTTTSWLMVSQTVVFLAVCGFAWWAARLLVEAAETSSRAAEHAVQAARDAESTAADLRQMRDMLRSWVDQQPADAGGPATTGDERTDSAGAQTLLPPQGFVDRGADVDAPDRSAAGGTGTQRGRHARHPDSPWTAARRAASLTRRDR